MVDLIDFPTVVKDIHDLPEPGDPYRAFAPITPQPLFMLAFVFPDGSITSYRFSDLGCMEFSPNKLTGTGDQLNLRFSGSSPVEVRIVGRNLFEHVYYLGEQQIAWLRMLPEGQHIDEPAAPVITQIILPGDRA